MIDHPCAKARRISSSIEQTLSACSCALGIGQNFYVDTCSWQVWWDPTIIMAVYNNNDILMVHYEDLPDGDKGVISNAIEEFQNKCLLSYTKTRDNTIVQKYPLPRVLLHGQTDADEAKDRHFFIEVVDKSVRDAISSHNEAFLDTFHNTMKEVFHGFLVGQVGSAYYNIPHSSTQGTNQVSTSYQEAVPTGNNDVQAVQGSSEQA